MNKEIETEDHARASCGRWAVTSSFLLSGSREVRILDLLINVHP